MFIPLKAHTYNGKYPFDDIKLVRDNLYKNLYLTSAETEAEIRIKRKCGIITSKEVIDYYINNIMPPQIPVQEIEEFDESTDDQTDDHPAKVLKIDLHSNLTNKPAPQPASSSVNTSHFDKSDLVSEFAKVTQFQALNNSNHDESNNSELCRTLKLSHACDRKFCPEHLKIVGSSNFSKENLVYVCDFCQMTVSLEDNMKKHLKKYFHYSASEYIIEKSPNHDNAQYIFPLAVQSKICAIKSRASIRNIVTDETQLVFCPQCLLCFGTDTLACAMHYKWTHSYKNDYIYSIGDLKRVDTIYLDKKHKCAECNKIFKKLSDLIAHIDITKHFPVTKQGEINVYNCPFDNCGYKSIYFFLFKQHLLSHNYFNHTQKKTSDLAIPEVEVKINVYSIPTSFFHVSTFREENLEDRKEEIIAIDCLLDSLKGHNDQMELGKKIRARKDHLIKMQTTSACLLDGIN